jgi:hypothetical protein
VAGRQHDSEEKRVGTDEKCANALLLDRGEGIVEVTLGAGMKNLERLPDRRRCFLRGCPLRAWNADTTVFKSLGARLLRNPITGIAGCCASAASGHAVAAVASSVMSPRRLISSMALRPSRGVRNRSPAAARDGVQAGM